MARGIGSQANAIPNVYDPVAAATTGDPVYDYTRLLLPFNGSNGATSTTDESAAGRSVAFNGDAQLSTAQKKFGTAALLLDGTGDYLTITGNTALQCWDWTIECWIYLNATGANQVIFEKSLSSAWDAQFFVNSSNKLVFYSDVSGSVASTTSVTGSTWHFVRCERKQGTVEIFLNGVSEGTDAYATDITASTKTEYIGAQEGSSNYFNGYIDDFRISGVARSLVKDEAALPTSAFPTE